MTLSHLAIIPCPTGRTTAGLHKVSVFLVPRLREPGNLADYATWAQWGANVANLRFRYFEKDIEKPAFAITQTSAAVNPDIWRAVFGATVPTLQQVAVSASAFIDRTTTNFSAMDMATLAGNTEGLYLELAKLGKATPTGSVVQPQLDASQAADSLPAVDAFHAQTGNGATPVAPDFDFHASLKLMSAHPALMRALGLIIDLEVDLRTSPTAITEIQLRTNFPGLVPGAGADFTSREQIPYRMEVDAAGLPLVNLADYRTNRWVNFGSNKFAVNQGGNAQYAASINSLARELDLGETGDQVSLPVVEEAGLRVIHKELTAMIAAQVARAKSIEDKTDLWLKGQLDPDTNQIALPPKIRGDDATAGIRWDVQDTAKGTWRSLHQRVTAGVSFPRNSALNFVPVSDEGWWAMAMMTDGTFQSSPANTAAFYPVQEGAAVTRFRQFDTTDWRVSGDFMLWSGWSLSTKRPGGALDKSGVVAAAPDPSVPSPGDPAQAVVDPYAAKPASLERLRFSHRYQFRGRYVDLCGNSEALSATAPGSAVSITVNYGRTVPVPPPSVVRRQSRPTPGVGDFPTTIVIKSELTTPNTKVKKSDRMLFSPRINQGRLERHGKPAADGVDVADYKFLKDRDAVVLADQLKIEPSSGELIAGGAIKAGKFQPGPAKQPILYLPDPASSKVAFLDLPHTSSPFSVATGTWPDPESVILELIAGTGPPVVDAAQRKITVSLGKGETKTMRVSSPVDTKFLKHFKWYVDLTPTEQTAVKTAIEKGQHELFSPTTSVELVHAVRVPLAPPAFGDFSSERTAAGQTTIVVDGQLDIHQDTSDRVVLSAVWSAPDYSDQGGLTINPRGGSGVLLDAGVPKGAGNSQSWTDLAFDIRDTRRHTMRLSATAFSRFSEFFTQRKQTTVAKGVARVLSSKGVAEGTVRLYRSSDGTSLELRDHYDIDHRAGTATAKLTSALANGTGVYFDFIRLPVARFSLEATQGTRVASFDVPSSAAPPPPVVQSVLPAAARTINQTATKITVLHEGRLVRAHLSGPWNASGEGELLGVALKSDGTQTRWGRDATVSGASPIGQPSVSHATLTTETAASVDGLFDLAGYAVSFDAARDLLIGDVLLAAPGYRPFVQLSLCRYQPLSIAGQHVSPVVKTDVLRLGVSRTVTAKVNVAHQVSLSVKGADNVNVVTVYLEDADPAVSDPDLKWRTAGASVVLSRTGTTALATHSGVVTLPATGTARRLVIEDAEPVSREVSGAFVADFEVAYREVIEIPSGW